MASWTPGTFSISDGISGSWLLQPAHLDNQKCHDHVETYRILAADSKCKGFVSPYGGCQTVGRIALAIEQQHSDIGKPLVDIERLRFRMFVHPAFLCIGVRFGLYFVDHQFSTPLNNSSRENGEDGISSGFRTHLEGTEGRGCDY